MASADRPRAGRQGIGWGLRIWVVLVAALLLAPTLVVIPMSFSASETFEFPPREWSLRWYEEFFSSHAWMSSVLNSLQIGLLTAVLATAVGVAAAIGLDRTGFRGREMLRSAAMAPMIVPGIVVAVAIYGTFLRWQLNGTLLGFVLAHTVLALPFVVTSVATSLAGYDRVVETAAASLGASWWTTFRKVTLPLLAPGVASGFVFAFVVSLDEVMIALFLQTPDIRTLPVQMYNSITLEIDPTIAAASSLIVAITTIALLLPQLVRRRRSES
ncbi:ABC transporter permease [Amycolatopsis cihanbeyliensis]|uniref:Putative spermidine/putrescine transport system permease protein n=1 Tax=Amycolatopsis cihanbeyliensis TaxID=1128664 RepID=A0A542DFX5_AMYCI|nr:ABC transporter permease [Amycolatopsis cihanbeyliensis]TQJ01985.1 putative spermidine/putrescine transport system permease protein [Amycolatopsis cihanbeyliensis]